MAASLAGGEGIEAAELAIRAGLASLGRGVLEDLLTADAGYRGPRTGCGTGHQAEFVSCRPKTVDTVLGPVTVNRAWYHCAACGHGLAPRDAELGTAGQTMSPGLRKMSARAAGAVPFTPGAGLVAALAGITLTGKRPAGLPDKLYIAIDGTGVPMMTAETDGRPGKGEDGKARTREVKLACAFTQTTVDEDGYPVRDPHSSSYLATFAAAAGFGTLMAAEARRRGAGHVRQLTILGDGAHWIWNLAGQHFPEATQIADLYHAREHLHDLARLLAFMLGDHHDGWLAGRSDELDDGDIPALLSAARAFPLTGIKAGELDTALGYFETNAPRMRYKHFRSCGLFAGSGAVEAGCKAVIGQRLKLSGMHWSQPGATGILTLRCQQASGRREEIWQQPPHRSGAA